MRIDNRLRRVFSPLNATCDLIVDGGALHQIFRPDTDEYSPDRAITPLTIRPIINVIDPDGIFGNGIANAKLGDIKWLANKVDVSGNAKFVIDTSATNNKGTLKVYQNVTPDSPVNLYFEGIISDTRNGTSLKVNGSVLLNTNTVSKEKVSVEIDKPNVILFNPISTPKDLIIKSTTYLADTILHNANIRAWWYKKLADGTLSLVNPNEDLEYISGIDTPTLKLDQRFINKKKDYRVVVDFVKTGAAIPSVPTARAAFLDFSIRRKFPNWEAEIQTYGDITATQKYIKTKVLITADRNLLPNPANYFSIGWYTVNSSGTEQKYGIGADQEIPAEIAGIATGGIDVGADIREKECLKALAVKGIVITNGGKIIIV